MFGQAVRPSTFVTLHKKIVQFGFSTGATDATQRVRDDTGRIDEPRLQQGNSWQQNTGGIASRRGDQGRLLNLCAIDFRQSINGLRSEEHTSELQSHSDLVCRLLLEKKNK